MQPYYEAWRNSNRYEMVTDVSVAIFIHVRSDANILQQSLNSLKTKTYKFICFGDFLDYSSHETTDMARRLIRDFFDTQFPISSEFELHVESPML